MPSYFGKQIRSSEKVSDRYLCINNCGYYEKLTRMDVCRKNGRVDYQLIYIKSGEMLFETKGERKSLGGGTVYLYRPGQPQHYRICGVPTSFFWIHFTGTEVPEMLSFFSGAAFQTGDFPEFERYCRGFYMDCRLTDRYNELLYEGELIALFALLADKVKGNAAGNRDLAKIRKAVLAIHQSPELRLSNEELASLCGLNRSYFIRLFKSATGKSPQQYYTSLLIDKSKELLENTDYSVTEISGLCGVEDSLYFSRLFKKHTGISPANYRRCVRY